MKKYLLRFAVLPLLLVTSSCGGDEKGAVAPAQNAASARAADPVDPVTVEPVVGENARTAAEGEAKSEAVVPDLVAPDNIAPQGVDEASLSNAVIVAAAAARAAEEVRAAAAERERAEARKADAEAKAEAKKAAEEAEAKAAREKAEAEAKAEASLARRRISTRMFQLQHASAEEVAEKLNTTWSGDFGVAWKINKMAIAFPESNSVMVTAPAVVLEACEQVVNAVDVEPMQVYIEARFVELSDNVYHDIGIDWSMLEGMKGAVSLGGGIQQNRLGKGVANYKRTLPDGTSYTLSGSELTGGSDGEITYFNGTLDFSQMYVVLNALEGNQDARIFSNPKIIVSSGRKATVDMTTKYPNVKLSAKRTTNSGGDSLDLDMQMAAIPGEDKMMFAKESFFSWGISLDVTPRIGTNGLINVSIVPTISSQNGWVDAGTSSSDTESGTISARYPVIEVQRLVTEFAMASGTTAVIGGLSRTVEEQVDTGIPVLSSIPWIGPRIFGSSTRKKLQKEIIVFVTVGLVDPMDMRKDAGLPKNAILGRQYTKGQKLEPGDRPERNLEGIGSLDLRSLEDQAKDPLPPPVSESSNWIPFIRENNNNR